MTQANLRSMTGYARIEEETPLGWVEIELRSVNFRHMDLTVSTPRELNALEQPIRRRLQELLHRGKLDCRVRFIASAQYQPRVALNGALAREYLNRLRELKQLGASGEVTVDQVASMPGVLEVRPAEIEDEAVWAILRPILDRAVERINADRDREGRGLAEQLVRLATGMRGALDRIEGMQQTVVRRYRDRLEERIGELLSDQAGTLDPGRLEMEAALFADRSDISEEITRLRVHLDRFDELLQQPPEAAVGKNLEFLGQELLREVNTICSKSRDTEVSAEGLELKNLVETIREQIHNIE